VGYRYWTTTGKHPLFPFGFGLSYTKFSFTNLKAPATAASGATVPVSFDVTNTGSVAARKWRSFMFPTRRRRPCAGARVEGIRESAAGAGRDKTRHLNLDARAFSYWDEAAHKWTIDPGSL